MFGLTDNPFDPRTFRDLPQDALDELSTRPLRIDDHRALEHLFVAEAGPFRQVITDYVRQLSAAGFQTQPVPSIGSKSSMFRVLGPEGSGKSTVTNLMVTLMQDCAAPDGIPVLRASAGTGAAALSALRAEIDDLGQRACCVIVDDVTAATERETYAFYEELRARNLGHAVVMFTLIHDAEALTVGRAARVYPHDLRTSWLSGEHAMAFLSQRIQRFRDATYEKLLVGDLRDFPFDTTEVGAMVAGEDREPLTLRTLSIVLSRSYVHELARRGPQDAIAQLTRDELLDRRIRPAEIYDTLFRERLAA